MERDSDNDLKYFLLIINILKYFFIFKKLFLILEQ